MPPTEPGSQRFDLDLLFQVMQRGAEPTASVSLHVCDGVRDRLFYFVPGGVRMLSRGDGKNRGLVKHLMTRCFVDAETLQELLEEAEARPTSLCNLIEEREILSREELGEIVNKVVRDDLLELVFWSDSVAIVQDEPPREIYTLQDEVLVGRLEGRDLSREMIEWAQLWARSKSVLASDASVVVATDTPPCSRDELDPLVEECLDLCAEEVEIRALWRESGQDLPRICAALVGLVEKGLVQVRPPAPETTRPKQALEARILEIEQHVESCLRPTLAREKLVECYRAAGENHNVVHHLHLLVEASVEVGATWAALGHLAEILELEKENVEAHERVVRVLVDDGQEEKAVAHAATAARAFFADGALEEARLLARLLESTPGGEIDGRTIRAQTCAAGGEVDQAVDRYVALAGDLVAVGCEKRGLELFQEALRLDPDHHEALKSARALKMAGVTIDTDSTPGGRGATAGAAGKPLTARSRPPAAVRRRPSWKAIAVGASVLIVVVLGAGFALGLWSLSNQRPASAVETHDEEGVDHGRRADWKQPRHR